MPDGPADLDIAGGLSYIRRADPDMARAMERVEAPEQRRRAPGFAALVNIIISQQISLQSAAAIGPVCHAVTHVTLRSSCLGWVSLQHNAQCHAPPSFLLFLSSRRHVLSALPPVLSALPPSSPPGSLSIFLSKRSKR